MNNPPQIAQNYISIGEKKAKTEFIKTLILGMYAGLYIGLGALCSSIASYNVTPEAIGRIFQGIVFPIGLYMVLCSGAELFTGNCLLIIPFLSKNITILELLKSWLTVYLGNFIGAIFLCVLVCYGHILDLYEKKLAEVAVNLAYKKVNMSFGDAFVKGILCNTLVCLSVWTSLGSKELSGKILALWPPIFLFVSCGMEHSIANMYFIPVGLMAKEEYNVDKNGLNWGMFFYKNLLPVTLGNICGGGIIVGIGYWFIYLKNDNSEEKENKNINSNEKYNNNMFNEKNMKQEEEKKTDI